MYRQYLVVIAILVLVVIMTFFKKNDYVNVNVSQSRHITCSTRLILISKTSCVQLSEKVRFMMEHRTYSEYGGGGGGFT